MTFSCWTSSDVASLPARASLFSVDTGLPLPVGVRGPGVGEPADEGGSAALSLVLEGDASK